MVLVSLRILYHKVGNYDYYSFPMAAQRVVIFLSCTAEAPLIGSTKQYDTLLSSSLSKLAHLESDVLALAVTVQPEHQPLSLTGLLLQVQLQVCLILQEPTTDISSGIALLGAFSDTG